MTCEKDGQALLPRACEKLQTCIDRHYLIGFNRFALTNSLSGSLYFNLLDFTFLNNNKFINSKLV